MTRLNSSLIKFATSILLAAVSLQSTSTRVVAGEERPAERPIEISGRYPSLMMMNHQGECGTGAVVPWADRLWVITYAPHKPAGSDDKLYEIDANLNRITRPESVGGTPANRMIHRESNQLNIGPYFIDAQGKVRVIPQSEMPGRLTATARHLTDPVNKLYIYDMEGTLFEVDVHTLSVKKLFARAAPGAHGKGAYTGQGRLLVANNGNDVVNKASAAAVDAGYKLDTEASGALAQWDGKEWAVLERRQFTDITGPGGINGAPDEKSPVWAIGWDKRSVLLKLLDAGSWHTFRLPVADYSYVARHGWYTEWPRIREVSPGKFLMNMHGQWFDFPRTFSAAQTGGIRPLGDYLKITGDFCGWQNRIVFGCDDGSVMQNPLLGQSESNLWFTTWEGLGECGRPAAFGGPWANDTITAGEYSEPYLISGYSQRVLHLSHGGDKPVAFTIELDREGHGAWTPYQTITVPAHGYVWHIFPDDLSAEWVRMKTDSDCPDVTAYFHYGPGGGATHRPELFASVPAASDKSAWTGGSLSPLGGDVGTLLFTEKSVNADGKSSKSRQLELDANLHFNPHAGDDVVKTNEKNAADAFKVTLDPASVILTEGKQRFRLPISDSAADVMPEGVECRQIREVVTERFLLNASGSLFVLPRPTAGGASRIKPLCTHNKRFTDFCSWRGLLVLAGNRPDAAPDGHYFAAPDGATGLWLGDIDDLWSLGKPRGHGGPWLNTAVAVGTASDPFLMAGYDHKTLELSHDSPKPVHISVEVDYLANGSWHVYKDFEVPPGQTIKYEFPAGYSAQWLRTTTDFACHATAQLRYE